MRLSLAYSPGSVRAPPNNPNFIPNPPVVGGMMIIPPTDRKVSRYSAACISGGAAM